MAFTGFPSGKSPYVPVPEVFFTEVVPDIEDTTELKVMLHLFWLLAQRQGNPRCASDRELQADRVLLRSLRRRGDPRPPEELLRQGLDSAVARGTLLRIYLKVMSESNTEAEVIGWYFFNTARSRKVVDELQGGEMVPARLLVPKEDAQAAHIQSKEPISVAEYTIHSDPANTAREPVTRVQVQLERPNVFVLYEQNIGLLSPMIAEELKDAAERYPAEWIESAFREAVLQNKRKWSYIRAILRRWETEGRHTWNA
jgi:DNA replication protein